MQVDLPYRKVNDLWRGRGNNRLGSDERILIEGDRHPAAVGKIPRGGGDVPSVNRNFGCFLAQRRRCCFNRDRLRFARQRRNEIIAVEHGQNAVAGPLLAKLQVHLQRRRLDDILLLPAGRQDHRGQAFDRVGPRTSALPHRLGGAGKETNN